MILYASKKVELNVVYEFLTLSIVVIKTYINKACLNKN